MPESVITHLRHIDLAVPDLAKQRAFYSGIWGLKEEHTDSGMTFLAAEGSPEQYVVRLREAAEKRVDLIAFGAATAGDVDTLAARLAGEGIELVNEPSDLQTPGGGYGFRFFDNEGRTVEVSSDVAVRTHRVIEEGESIPVRLSHVVMNSPDIDGTRDWYAQHLGFRLTDSLMHPKAGGIMHFLRINSWHHSLALATGPHPSLHHASFELRGIDEYMRGTGRMLRAGVEKLWGPGRHKAGDNTFSYFLDPHGNTVEYTTELELIDEDTWHPSIFDLSDPEVSDQWGTANDADEFVVAKSFNDKDRGLFVAPPA
ncbi:VOC family protein [Mycolicibacterium sp. CBMA 226]|uniref:VOC family protein n=1 Tax=Mycolicibacterium sp. CBMA 226 TaxID=2606611 RepID=UPI00130BEC1A|nr:VOC family protein [Mycolicibacterium sp. CBMA 226]MUL79004.1 oxidoreductase [Mycolicibacterium sp. CBMA 226]QGW61320.1 Metapyrocatechase [Mycolicibacterium sp.]